MIDLIPPITFLRISQALSLYPTLELEKSLQIGIIHILPVNPGIDIFQQAGFEFGVQYSHVFFKDT